MRQQKRGKKRSLALALLLPSLFLSGCRKSQPPKIEICIGDGFGGADCIEADGSHLYRSPSSLKNYWMTSQPDEANYASWCYDASPSAVTPAMDRIREEAQR